jgi:hypothetical protein
LARYALPMRMGVQVDQIGEAIEARLQAFDPPADY